MKRIHYLDSLRGLTIISMIFYHLFYDLVYIFNVDIDFYKIEKVWIWQLSIAISFFLISGFSSYLTKKDKLLKRGIILSLIGFLFTLATYIFVRDELIIFGVLNGLGISMIFCGLFKDQLDRIDYKFSIFIFLILFIVFYNISFGYINLFFRKISLPDFLYEMNLFFIGFKGKDFYSSDYFPFLPWSFIYLTGFYLGKWLKEKDFYNICGKENIISKIGRQSLKIYILHQIVIFGALSLIFKILDK
ncbi:DUF1624 domain-containing protein [Peptoniphilus obesi]|uniref:DUF1624 domain-containing protein n=1 Tax=Peptoniphilus obesi TaxID=1472765 RepID=UPI0004B2CF9D|nr:heparan-alpha-glucosaminide N-acetyltransferase domain-containing protein [Peptoniphilus obesi]